MSSSHYAHVYKSATYICIFFVHLTLHDFKRRDSLPAQTLFTTDAETLLFVLNMYSF